MNEFKTYHPIVNFVYFVFVIGFSCFLMHPMCLAMSLACGFSYLVFLKGRGALKNLIYMIPMIMAMALINPLFNHKGVTTLMYLPSSNPLTLESIIYGISAATMIACVICWFNCYNEVMTSDKFIYLFGKVIPSLSLVLSMTLRFVPRFISQLKKLSDAQKCIGRDITGGNIIQRAKHGISILSAMITWAFENSIETADSMKSRGYGMPKRTAFSVFRLDKRDKRALACIVALGIYTFYGNITGKMYFVYFPSVKMTELSPMGISVFLAYFILCMCPMIIELWEVIRWQYIKSKM